MLQGALGVRRLIIHDQRFAFYAIMAVRAMASPGVDGNPLWRLGPDQPFIWPKTGI
jgi:hypothetical protein